MWSAEDGALCLEAKGACWPVIDARHRLILVGLYPHELHWRSTLACTAIIATVVLSCLPFIWTAKRLTSLWILGWELIFLDGFRADPRRHPLKIPSAKIELFYEVICINNQPL